MSVQDELVFLPLGGSGEIGMNLNLYGFGPEDNRQWIIVDLGVTFGDDSTPGIDLICPDPEYIEEYSEDLLALVLTHAHEDHIGAVALLWPRLKCPIYATAFTAEMVRLKLAEAGIDNAPLHIVDLGAHLTFGPFDIEFITLTHSIPEPNGLAIRTPLGTVLHTGDWKIDPRPPLGAATDDAALRKLGDEGVLAMICDSTNVFSPGESGSEADVRQSLGELISELDGRIAVTTFASNVTRVESVIKAAEANDRSVALIGRSMHRIVAVARSVGMLQTANFVPVEEAGFLPPEKILYLCTGSQGEPRAALSRIARGDSRDVVLGEGDAVVFSSRVIPGNEVGISALQNDFAEQGVRVITERDHFIHVSGHPCRDELRQMYEWVRPKIAVPVHGEARHIAEHARFALELGAAHSIAPANGDLIRLAPGPAAIIDEVPAGRLLLDGEILVSESDGALPDRRRMAYGGLVAVAAALDANDRLAAPIELSLMGAPRAFVVGGEPLETVLADAIEDALDSLPSRMRNEEDMETVIRRVARKAAATYWGKKPEVTVMFLKI